MHSARLGPALGHAAGVRRPGGVARRLRHAVQGRRQQAPAPDRRFAGHRGVGGFADTPDAHERGHGPRSRLLRTVRPAPAQRQGGGHRAGQTRLPARGQTAQAVRHDGEGPGGRLRRSADRRPDGADEATEVVDHYLQRWRVEDYFRVLTAVRCVERMTFRTAVRMQRAIATNSVIAWKLTVPTLLARQVPTLAADLLITAPEPGFLSDYARAQRRSGPDDLGISMLSRRPDEGRGNPAQRGRCGGSHRVPAGRTGTT